MGTVYSTEEQDFPILLFCALSHSVIESKLLNLVANHNRAACYAFLRTIKKTSEHWQPQHVSANPSCHKPPCILTQLQNCFYLLLLMLSIMTFPFICQNSKIQHAEKQKKEAGPDVSLKVVKTCAAQLKRGKHRHI